MPAEIVTMRDCASNYGIYVVQSDSDPNKKYTVTFSGESGAHCTCKAWEFSGNPKNCKHIDRVYTKACMYNPQYHEGKAKPEIFPVGYTYDMGLMEDHSACPACGWPTVLVRRAV